MYLMSQSVCVWPVIAVMVVVGATLVGCTDEEEAAKEVPSERPVANESAETGVVMETSMGTIKLDLWADRAPQTVTNFLKYVDDGFYDGLIFHRVMDGFMIQGGGFTPDMKQKPTSQPVRNEATPELRNDRGTLAMARTPDPHSASSQFFINLVDNNMLNHTAKTPQGYGYCAFGEVVDGMEVVDKIAKVSTKNAGPHANVPAEPVIIKSVRRAN